MDADVDDGWLSIQEAADALGLHYRTVWKMARSGELASERDESTQGQPYRVRRADMDAFIERSRVKPGEPAHLRPRRLLAQAEHGASALDPLG